MLQSFLSEELHTISKSNLTFGKYVRLDLLTTNPVVYGLGANENLILCNTNGTLLIVYRVVP